MRFDLKPCRMKWLAQVALAAWTTLAAPVLDGAVRPAPGGHPSGGEDKPRQAMRESVEMQLKAVEQMRHAVEVQKKAAMLQRKVSLEESSLATAAARLPGLMMESWPAEEQREYSDQPCQPLPAEVWKPLVEAAAARYGLAAELVAAVIQQESGFCPCAVSPKGAMGLMQLMPATALMLGVLDPFDPRQNIEAGTRYLKSLLVRYGGNLALALAAYNAGAGRVDESGGIPPIPETRDYVHSILGLLGK